MAAHVGNRLRTLMKVAALGAIAVAAGLLVAPAEANAQWGFGIYSGSGAYGGYSTHSGYAGRAYSGYGGNAYSGYGGSSYGHSGSVYHPPSVHYDRVYHATPHWTPFRGWHSHGHVDVVPHYTPGHFDQLHGNHLHGDPRYHHD